MDIRVDGRVFSETDARRTVAEAVDLIDEFAPRHHRVLAARRARLAALNSDLDAWRAPIGRVAERLESVVHELAGARDDLVAAGVLPRTARGSVVALHLGDGGVPKRAVDAVDVDLAGVVGDRQVTRRHHGAPWQALCLWSEEVVAALAAGGHPIGPGAAGENVTIVGLPWGDVTPGTRLALGSVLCEISSFAVPCRQNAVWFTDRDFDRIHFRHGPVSRVYATVLEPGRIDVGDAVVLEP
jgi:hypothetical protein